MSHHVYRLTAWSVSRRVILAVALAAAFFVAAWMPVAQAQGRADRPDFRIIKASFNGRDLHVEYVNATGVGYPRVRYEVGFQWYDAARKPVGERHWLPVPEVERGGVAILDTKYRTDLTYRRSGGNYNRRLLDFVLQRPNTAEELRITVDDGDRVSETDESNNVASLRIPLPDLQITGATFRSPNQLELSYRNANPSPIPLPFRIGFTWAAESGAHLTPTRWINVLEPRDGVTETTVLSRTDVSYITPQGRQAGDRLDWYFERRPGNATRLKVTMDDEGTVREQNEQNNLVSVRPFLPDLVVRDAKLDGDRLTFTYGNDGEGYIRDIASRVAFQWMNAAGKPVGEPRWSRWYGFAQMDPKQTFTVNAERFDVQYAVGATGRTTTQRLSTYLGQRPEGATQLRITIDDEQKLHEANEENNSVAVVMVPDVADGEPKPVVKMLPDLAITAFSLGEEATGDILRIQFRNLGGSTALTRSGDSLIPFWLVWTNANGQPVAGASSYWFDLRREPLLAGGEGAVTVTLANGAILVPHGADRGAGRTITQFFADPPTGATHLQAIIDGPNRIEESNETNNTAIIERPAPDLIIEKVAHPTTDSLTIQYRNVGAINAVDRSGRGVTTFWFTWTNADGKAVAGATRYWVDNRSNALLRPGEERTLTLREALGAVIVPHGSDLKSGRTLAQFLVAAPEDATHLQVMIDGPDAYAESNEENNIALLLKPVQPKPDLTFTNVFLVPPKRERLVIGFENRGKVEAPEFPWAMSWVDSTGTRIGTSYEGIGLALKSSWRFGASSDMSDPNGKPMPIGKWLAQPKPDGATQLEIVIDPANVIAESNEQNNRQTFDQWSPPKLVLPPPKLPDLTITDATLDTAALRFWYHNRGESPVMSKISIWYEWVDVNGGRVGELRWINVGAMSPKSKQQGNQLLEFADLDGERGKMFLGTFVANAPESATHLKLTIDGPNAHAEANEQNNTVLLLKPVVPRADLRIPDFSMDPVAPRAGDRVWFTARVENVGSATTGQPMATGIILDSDAASRKLIGQFTTAIIPAGKSAMVRWTKENYYGWVAEEGMHTIDICADRAKTVEEADETNNCARKTVTVPAPEPPKQPDLTVDSVNVQDGYVRIVVKNVGSTLADATDIWLMWFGAKGALPSSAAVDLPAIAGRAEVVVIVPFDGKTEASRILRDPPKDGTKLRVFLDGSRKVKEAVEDNNDAYLDRAKLPALPPEPMVNKLPDLVVRDLVITPERPLWNTVVSFTARVENVGEASVGRSTATWLNLVRPRDGSMAIPMAQQPTTPDLAPGASAVVQWEGEKFWTIQNGENEVIICAESMGYVRESNEQNNCARKKFTVAYPVPAKPAKPDLVVEQVFVLPSKPTASSRVEFATVIRNVGKAAAEESIAYVVLDLDADGDPDGTPEPIDIPALKVGESRAVTWPDAEVLPAGTHTIEVCVDVGEDVDEVNEENNCRELTFMVGAPSRSSFLLLPLRLVLDVFSTPIRAGTAE